MYHQGQGDSKEKEKRLTIENDGVTTLSPPSYTMPAAHKNGISIHLFPSEMKPVVSQNTTKFTTTVSTAYLIPHPCMSAQAVKALKSHVTKSSQPRVYNIELCYQIWDPTGNYTGSTGHKL